VKDAWHSFRGGDKTNEEALSTFGLDFLKTNTFDKRIEEFKEFNTYLQDTLTKTDDDGKTITDDPTERIKFVQERMIGINERIYKTAIAWITAGDTGWGAKATLAWATLFTAILTSVNHTQELLKKSDFNDDRPNWLPPASKYASVSKVEYLFSTVYLKYAQFLLSISYKARDVIPTKVAIVQNIPQQPGGIQQVRSRFPGEKE
jgi:hypothetical protein